ncbi:MAG: glycoside hydrolase family 2, partial [Prevotella sp.]|nr:glycoside hydrolase family 2 [Prevotella sp.]
MVSQQLHRQEVSANFGLKGIQSDTENPHSRTATQYPQRVEPTVMASRLEQVADNKWTLKDGWILLENDAVVASDFSIFSDEFSPEEWYNAVVPGTVLTSLVEQGVYPDPYFGVNNMAIPEGLCRKEWWYRTMLILDQEMLDKRVIQLLFNGINYRADVWLNGVKLGTVNGAFCRGLFDIKEVARKDNILAVHIYPPFNPGFPHEQSAVSGRGPNGGQLCLDGPTFISSEGWDWMPGVRDRNIGIWQDVLLQVNDGISINDTHVITDLPLPSVDYADLIVETELQN